MCTAAIGEPQPREPDRRVETEDRDEHPEGAGVARLPTGETLRPFDIHREDVARLIRLKETVYGLPIQREVFAWEYFGHPSAKKIRVFVCESDGKLLAATTRLPATLLLGGAPHPAYFNVESMVHPDERRRGRMRDLYKHARNVLPGPPLMFSKGSADQIYPMLMSIGQRPLLPNTFLVSRPSTARWLMSRLHLRSVKQEPSAATPPGFDDFAHVERYEASFDAFFARVGGKFAAIFARDAALMNWRYVDIPHRRYASFARVEAGEITSVVVLALRGDKGLVVDIVWDPDRADEPERSVRFAQAWLAENGAASITCFATCSSLRAALVSCGFVDRGMTPRFSAFVPPRYHPMFAPQPDLHVVDGDGDTEFS